MYCDLSCAVLNLKTMGRHAHNHCMQMSLRLFLYELPGSVTTTQSERSGGVGKPNSQNGDWRRKKEGILR